MSDKELLHGDLTEQIIKSFYQVYNTLGYGFLEKVYENSLSVTLKSGNHEVLQQFPIAVHYEDQVVGEYFADLFINRKVIVEVKCCEAIAPQHEAQLVNYLKATGTEVGLLLNFGPKAEFRRKVCTTSDQRPSG